MSDKLDAIIESCKGATVEPAGMFFSTKFISREDVESIARTALNAFLLNLEASGVHLAMDDDHPLAEQPQTPSEGEGIEINDLVDHLPAYSRDTAPVNESNATHIFADEDGNVTSMYIVHEPNESDTYKLLCMDIDQNGAASLIKGVWPLPNGSAEQTE